MTAEEIDWEDDWIDQETLKFLKNQDHTALKAKWQVIYS